MSSTQRDDQVMNILKQCFPNIEKFRITENSVNGMHQRAIMSDVIDLTVEYQEDGVEHKKFLVLKVPKQGGISAFLEKLAFYRREAFMYDVLIPRISAYLDTPLSPFCFKTIDSKTVILENLTFYGYVCNKKKSQLHLKECLPIVEALAHFHASSHKVVQTDPHFLEDEIFHYSALMEWRTRMATFWDSILVELLARNNESVLVPKVKEICLYLKSEDNDFRSRIRYSNFKFVVLNHGDFHTGNILLKYGSNDSVDGVKMIDFQASFWSTPACDFMYFFILCAEADLMENHFQTLLDWYLQCLNEKLKTMNCSTVYERDDFLEDIRTLNFCSILYIMTVALILYPLDTGPLVHAIYHKNTENIQYFIDVCLSDEVLKSQVLRSFKLCERLELLKTFSKG